jgi:hypothetical protein
MNDAKVQKFRQALEQLPAEVLSITHALAQAASERNLGGVAQPSKRVSKRLLRDSKQDAERAFVGGFSRVLGGAL